MAGEELKNIQINCNPIVNIQINEYWHADFDVQIIQVIHLIVCLNV